MGLKTSKNLIEAVSNLQETDYSKNPKLGDIYKRILKSKKQVQNIMSKDIQAIMQISSLDLTLNHVTEEMKTTSQMKWLGMVNNIRHRAEEIILKEIIYS